VLYALVYLRVVVVPVIVALLASNAAAAAGPLDEGTRRA
jgi:hypothetical protein